MFSRIDPIFSNLVRKVKQSDPRMDIKKDGHDNTGGKRKDTLDETPSPLWEDHTDVSVVTLISFLEAIMAIATHTPLQEGAPTTTALVAPPPSPAITTPADQQRAKAIAAYKHAGPPVPPPQIDSAALSPAIGDLQVDFSEDELVLLQSYVADLRLLLDSGVHSISLRRCATFLTSIAESIAAARPGL